MKKTEQRGRFARTAARLFGDPLTESLEHRVLNAMTFLACLAAVVSTGANLLLGMPTLMTVSTLVILVIGVVLYLLSRKAARWQPLTTPSIVIFVLLLAITWTTQGERARH